jgi:CRISPR-associated endonuclease/helicase Cas3
LFSCLVDADGLDTEAHRLGLAPPRVRPPADMAELCNRFETRRKAMLAVRGPVGEQLDRSLSMPAPSDF